MMDRAYNTKKICVNKKENEDFYKKSCEKVWWCQKNSLPLHSL